MMEKVKNITDTQPHHEPGHLTDTLRKIVSDRWPEIASFALNQCGDGYNAGYVLITGPQDALQYVAIPDRELTMSDAQRPWTLEQAVLAKDNCEEFIVVAFEAEGSLVWRLYTEVDGQNMREAANAFNAESAR